MRHTLLTTTLLAGAAVLAGNGALRAEDLPTPPRSERDLPPEARAFLQQAPRTRELLRLRAAPVPLRFTMPVQVKNPADYPIVVTRGKDALYPIRIVRPGGMPGASGDGSTPPRTLIVPLPPNRNPALLESPKLNR